MTGLQDDLGLAPRDLANSFFRAGWTDVVAGRADLLATLRTALEGIAPTLRAEDLIAYWFEMSSRIVQPVLSDVRDARSRGVPVFLATNQCHARADYLMDAVGLRSEVDGIVYSAQAGHPKPEAGFYAFAEDATGHPPGDLLMVDDKSENVEAAEAAGWRAVHWTEGDSLSAILRQNT